MSLPQTMNMLQVCIALDSDNEDDDLLSCYSCAHWNACLDVDDDGNDDDDNDMVMSNHRAILEDLAQQHENPVVVQSWDSHQHLPHSKKAKRHITGRRRCRADIVRTVFGGHDGRTFRDMENVQVECRKDSHGRLTVHRVDLWDLLERTQAARRIPPQNIVVVAVETSYVGLRDEPHRQGPLVGTRFVGVVHHAGAAEEEKGVRPGARVAALVRRGGAHARYVVLDRHSLISVPKSLDPGELVCLLSVYLPAFQALHHGRPRPSRYSSTCLQGAQVLATAGAWLEAMAIVRLAYHAGAGCVFVECERHQFETIRQMHGVPVLKGERELWMPALEKRMDVVVDFDYANDNDDIWSLLPLYGGRLIWFVHPSGKRRRSRDVTFCEQTSICFHETCTIYDAFKSWDDNPEGFKLDLEFLCRLLVRRQIRPEIDKYITLEGIAEAHQQMQTKSPSGAVVCEPWKEEDGSSRIQGIEERSHATIESNASLSSYSLETDDQDR